MELCVEVGIGGGVRRRGFEDVDMSKTYIDTKVMKLCFFFQAEDGIRDAQESRGLGTDRLYQSINQTKVNQERKFIQTQESVGVEGLWK